MITAKEARERATKRIGIDPVESFLKNIDQQVCELSSLGAYRLRHPFAAITTVREEETVKNIIVNKLESLGFTYNSDNEVLSWDQE